MQNQWLLVAATVALLQRGALQSADPPAVQPRGPASAVLEARSFPVEDETGLEPEVLDLRYAPGRWQACIGLSDDPHKSMVGSDGGLYYDYGRGPYHSFRTRVRAGVDTEGPAGQVRQRLWDPRIPIVVTEQTTGALTLRQEAWAGAPESGGIEEWSRRRVDYLWLKLKNTGRRKAKGRIVVRVDSEDPLRPDRQGTGVFLEGRPERTFSTVSPPFAPMKEAAADKGPQLITVDHSPGINRDWARPKVPCDRRFRHVLVGWSRPLILRCRAEPGRTYRAALGLIEGYHPKAGLRPLEIRVETRVVRSLDLIREYGRNTPAVLGFDVKDADGDGVIEMAVQSPRGAPDNNTILSALWIYDAKEAPDEKEILLGGVDDRALAILDVDSAPAGSSLELRFEETELAPREEYRALLTFHRGELARARVPEERAGHEQEKAIGYWRGCGLPYDRIMVPDRAVQELLDSSIRNIYQAREVKDGRPAFQVGPTCYRGTWAADGPFIMEAITYLGRPMEVRAGLELQLDGEGGPGGVAFSKKAGLRLWMIWRHGQLTGDSAWLEKVWPRVEDEVRRIIQYREMTRDDPEQANYGLMPIGFGDGGLGGKHREYTNVYWTLAGLRAAAGIAERLKKPELAVWKAEYQDYWKVFERARNRDKLVDSAGNTYVPVTMKGEKEQSPQRGAWAFLQSIFPGRIFAADDELMLGTMAMLDANQREGLIYGTGWLADGIWNYAASFYGHAHLWLGHGKKAAATLYAFGNHACPLLCWREEQNPRGEKDKYVGDMPHNWASAEFIRMVRHLVILERGRELHLLEGLPHAWTSPGDATKLVEIPTSFGEVSLSLSVNGKGSSAAIRVDPPQREEVERIVVHLERFERPVKSVRLGGRNISGATEIRTDRDFTLEVDFEKESADP